MKYFLIVLIAVVAVLSSCRREDIRTAVIDVPQLTTPLAKKLIENKLFTVPNLVPGSLNVDIVERRVTVSYDSIELSLKNLEFDIASLGFNADDVPANKEAAKRLPPDLRPVQK